MRIIYLAIFGLIGFVPALQAAPAKLVQAELVADASAIAPGQPFTVAVKLTITPGWHVYWINPGDSGLPTTVKWNLPDGFTAEPLQYPAPRKIDVAGGLVNYGYEDQVVFLARITPPKDLPATGDVSIEGKISWLVCKENCIKGGETVNISVPVGEKSQAANQADFEKWQRMIPVDVEKACSIGIDSAPLDVSTGDAKGEIKATLPLKDCIAIPGPSDSMTITCGPATVDGKTFPIEAKVLAGQKVTETSVIILIVPTDSSSGGWEVKVPIVNPGAAPAAAPAK